MTYLLGSVFHYVKLLEDLMDKTTSLFNKTNLMTPFSYIVDMHMVVFLQK